MARRAERQPNPGPLGGYLASQVKERGMTLSHVAETTGKSVLYASKVFNGKIRQPGATFTVYLARDLGITIDDLSPYCEPEWKVKVFPTIEELSLLLPAPIIDSLKSCIPADPQLMPIFLKLVESLKQTALEQRRAEGGHFK